MVGKVLLFLLWNGAVVIADRDERWAKYIEARQRADEMGKQLLVVGGPYGRNSILCRLMGAAPTHGYGDCCVDIEEAAVLGAPRAVIADVRNMPFTDKEFGVVFCSHVLEELPGIRACEDAIMEMGRVADEILLCCRSKLLITNWLDLGQQTWVSQDRDGTIHLQARV